MSHPTLRRLREARIDFAGDLAFEENAKGRCLNRSFMVSPSRYERCQLFIFFRVDEARLPPGEH